MLTPTKVLAAGQMIHFAGHPFKLVADATVQLQAANEAEVATILGKGQFVGEASGTPEAVKRAADPMSLVLSGLDDIKKAQAEQGDRLGKLEAERAGPPTTPTVVPKPDTKPDPKNK